MMAKPKPKAKENEDQFANEFIDESKILVEVKVSSDDGESWQRRKISMISGLDESGLNLGEIFQFNGEKYRVKQGEDGIKVELINSKKK